MDFIYELGGVVAGRRDTARCSSATRRRHSSSPRPRSSRRQIGIDDTIFADAFTSCGRTSRPRDAEADHPVAEHGALPRRAGRHRPGGIPGHRRSSGTTCPPRTPRRCAALAELGCTYLQFDDTSLAYLNDPAQRAEIAAQGDDAEHQHLRYIRQINARARGQARGDGHHHAPVPGQLPLLVGGGGQLRLRRRGPVQRARRRRVLPRVRRRRGPAGSSRCGSCPRASWWCSGW